MTDILFGPSCRNNADIHTAVIYLLRKDGRHFWSCYSRFFWIAISGIQTVLISCRIWNYFLWGPWLLLLTARVVWNDWHSDVVGRCGNGNSRLIALSSSPGHLSLSWTLFGVGCDGVHYKISVFVPAAGVTWQVTSLLAQSFKIGVK